MTKREAGAPKAAAIDLPAAASRSFPTVRGYWFPVFGFAETGMTAEKEARPRIPSAVTPPLTVIGRATRDPRPIGCQSDGGRPVTSPLVIPHAAKRRCGIGEPG